MSAVSLWSMLKEHPYVWRHVALFTLPVVAACSAEPVTPPRAPVAVVDLGPQRRLVDPEITTTDSYFTSDVTLDVSMTIDSTEAFPDPATLQNVTSWTYTAPTSTFYVEGGHDVYGRTRLNTQVRRRTDAVTGIPSVHQFRRRRRINARHRRVLRNTDSMPPRSDN